MPILLYGLDACPLNKSDINGLDFVVNQFFMKLLVQVIECQLMFNFKDQGNSLHNEKAILSTVSADLPLKISQFVEGG